MPVRKIGVTSRSVRSGFPSIKTGETHITESTLETDFLFHLEFDPSVKTYEAQPVAIPYINEKGKKSKYVPDVKVTFTKSGAQQKGFKFFIYEIKEIRELEEQREEFALKFKAAELYCAKENGRFVVSTEADIRNNLLKSYKFLYRYLSNKSIPKLKINILDIAKSLQPVKVQDLINSIEDTEYVRLKALSNVWHLVANNHLHIDLEKPITNSSIITVKPT